MGKFDGVLLVSDFDDTLYTQDGLLPEANRRAAEYFVSEGGYFTVATGRAHPTFAPCAHLVPINVPVVLSNGSALYDFQKDYMVYETFLPMRVAEDMAQVAGNFPALGFEAYHGDDIYAYNPNLVTQNHLARSNSSCKICPIEDIPLPWNKAILQQYNHLLRQVQEYMLARWSEHYEVIFSNEVLLELTRKGSNKGGMVRYLADLLGVTAPHIYCVGDNQNDLPMLEIAAVAFAPVNCADEVKKHGVKLLRPCEEGCIAEVVEFLDRRY